MHRQQRASDESRQFFIRHGPQQSVLFSGVHAELAAGFAFCPLARLLCAARDFAFVPAAAYSFDSGADEQGYLVVGPYSEEPVVLARPEVARRIESANPAPEPAEPDRVHRALNFTRKPFVRHGAQE